jgi:hypothetical protein
LISTSKPLVYITNGTALGKRGEREPVKGVVDFIEDFKNMGEVPELSPYVRDITNLPRTFEGSIRLMPAGNAPSPKYSKQLADIRLPELFNPIKAEEERTQSSLLNSGRGAAIP